MNARKTPDYRQYAVLYVDDEEQCLTLFRRAFEEDFQVYTAANTRQGFELLEKHRDEIGIVVSDQRMPEETGVRFLERTRKIGPRMVRILVTAYTEVDVAIEAINGGAIYKYVHKPWEIEELRQLLRQAMEIFLTRKTRDRLLRQKLATLHKTIVSDRVVNMSELAFGMGHHVRNALQSVQAFLEMMPGMLREENIEVSQLGHPDYWREFYEQALWQIKRIAEMFDNFGLISGGLPWQFGDEVSLRAMVDLALLEMRQPLEAKQIQVANEVDPDLPPIRVELPKFDRLLPLMLADELVHLPAGSRIVFRNRPGTDKERTVQLIIEDNGPGLSQAMQELIFDPFATRTDQPQEFGLNLMVCYFIAYQHGGTLEIRRSHPQGVAFFLTLPRQPVSPSEATERPWLDQTLRDLRKST